MCGAFQASSKCLKRAVNKCCGQVKKAETMEQMIRMEQCTGDPSQHKAEPIPGTGTAKPGPANKGRRASEGCQSSPQSSTPPSATSVLSQ